MRRRDFIAGLGSAATWPLAARSRQQAVPVVGVLSSGSQAEAANISAFQEGLRSTGYDEGRNVVVAHRWSRTLSGRNAAIATFVERGVAVIVTTVNSATHATKAATSTIPIVFFYGGDPVDEGLVASLNKPDSNLTGVTSFNIALGGKRLSLLGEMVPQANDNRLFIWRFYLPSPR
jgi:putative tryptophan/tyrosine transport system substrate-binding protein